MIGWMVLQGARLTTTNLDEDIGFFQLLGLALAEMEENRALLVPCCGPHLSLVRGAGTELTAVFSGMGPRVDLEGNPLFYEAPAADLTTKGQAQPPKPLYPVVDLHSSIEWYTRQLKLSEVFLDAPTQWAELQDERGGRIVLSFTPDLDTPAMLVLPVADAAAEVERLREFEVSPAQARQLSWGRIAAYRSPGGLAVLLQELH